MQPRWGSLHHRGGDIAKARRLFMSTVKDARADSLSLLGQGYSRQL